MTDQAEPTLDDLLSDDFELKDEPPAAADEPKGEPDPQGEPTGETKTEPEQGKEGAPPAPAEKDDKRIDPEQFKGYLDEREKRQRLERENEELRRKLEGKQEPTKNVDPVDDPDGFREALRKEFILERMQDQMEDMREAHSDFDAAWEWGNEAIKGNPILAQQLSQARNLPRAVYKAYQDHLKLQRVGDLERIEQENASLKARIAELEAGKAAEPEKQEQQRKAEAKPSLATTGTSNGTVETEGELALEDIVGEDFRFRPE